MPFSCPRQQRGQPVWVPACTRRSGVPKLRAVAVHEASHVDRKGRLFREKGKRLATHLVEMVNMYVYIIVVSPSLKSGG